MTLGASGGRVQPLTRAEVLELAENSPLIGTAMAARALGITEPLLREMANSGELEKAGIRVLRLGRLLKYPAADILAVLGIEPDTGSAGPAPPADPAAITQLRRPRHKDHVEHDDSPAA
jgi:hypothetical protein